MTNLASDKRGAAIYTPAVLKLYDFWVLGISNRFAWQCPTSSVLLPFFSRFKGKHHLDVGVGTGYYPAKTPSVSAEPVTLMDLNENSLHAAAARSSGSAKTVCHDVMQPLPSSMHGSFDSISVFYLLHCLPGTMNDKEKAVAHLKQGLANGGVLYGATILGDSAKHNAFGRRLMALYNRKGIFGNDADSLESLRAMLSRQFAHVEMEQHGKVALFIARNPL